MGELVDAAVRRTYPEWKLGGSYELSHPVWKLVQHLWRQYETGCVTVTDFDGMEIVSLCQTHLTEYAEEIPSES